MIHQAIEDLSSIPIFSGLDNQGLEAVTCAASLRRFATGETVFLQGELCIGLYIVKEGWLKSIIASPAGREQIIRLLRPGDVFNEIGMLTHGRNLVTTQALEDSRLWIIEQDTFLRLMDEYPALCRAIIKIMSERVLHLMKLVEDLSLRSVKSRMARILQENAIEGVISRRRWMTQIEMAARLGTVLDVANRTLNSLVNEGLISFTRGEIRILNQKRIEELAVMEE